MQKIWQKLLLFAMAYEDADAMFSFPQMLNAMSSEWPVEVQTNGIYRCSQITLSQLQEKVMRSLSKKYDDDNLQVVPQNDNAFEGDSPSSYRESCAVKCRENRAKMDPVGNNSIPSTRERTDEDDSHQSLSQSPNLRITPILAISTCTSTEPLRTPTFQFSPLVKSPAHRVSAPVSPLAMMIISPFGRNPSEDLSIYLPENFTPAATLERLERAINTTVFEFPSVEENQTDNKSVRSFERGKLKEEIEEEDSDINSTRDNFHVNNDDVFVDINDDDYFELKTEGDCNFGEQLNSLEGRKKREGRKEIETNRGEILGFRNKLERKRRSEMNSKYDKLRQCIPDIDKRQKVAKIVVLRSAVEYIKELQRQDKLLTKQKNLEKLKNDELLKKLVKINS